MLSVVSCGKEKTDATSSYIKKGSGKLILKNVTEVLDYRSKIEGASTEFKILEGAAPVEEYVLVIEDIAEGDYIELTEAKMNSWLTLDQKERVKESNGCLEVTFFGATYIPATNEKEASFSPGDISLKSSCR